MGRHTLDGINIYHEDNRVYFHKESKEFWLEDRKGKWSIPDDDDELKDSLLNDGKVSPLELVEWND